MINKLAGILLLSAISLTAVGQSTESSKSVGTPDIPGTFTLELGLNRGLDAPSRFDLGLFGSRSVNLYYQYEIRILKSRMSFVPGIGLSLERYKFRNGGILSYPSDNRDSVYIIPVSEHQLFRLKKSQLIANYIEVPLELRYSSNPDDPARSFKASVGARIGYLYDGFSKVKFREDGEIKKVKDKQSYNLNRFRYGVSAKVGFGNFALFGYYNLTPLFKENEGFYNMGEPINFNTFTVGISLSSF
jgi:hypothetical protein